jgi:hypothetical protein
MRTESPFTIDLADHVTCVNPNIARCRYDGYGRQARLIKIAAAIKDDEVAP